MKVTVESVNTPTLFQFGGDTAELRIYASKDFLSYDRQLIPQGSPFDERSWYLPVPCTITGGDILLVEGFEIDSTEDGDPNNAKYIAALFDSGGAYVGPFPLFKSSGFKVPAIESQNWASLQIYNRGRTLVSPPLAYLNAHDVSLLIQTALDQQRQYASDTLIGSTYLSVPPVSPPTPIAVGDNDPRVPTQDENDALVGTNGAPDTANKYVTNSDPRLNKLNGSGDLVSTSGITIGADSDASGTNSVQLQTRGIDRLVVENDGDFIFGRVGTDEVDLMFATTDATAAYGITTHHADFAGVRDHVMDIGFNQGAVSDPLKERLYVSFESRFKSGAAQYGEVNWEARYSPGGIVSRFQSFSIDWVTGDQIHQFNGAFSIADKLGTTGHIFIADDAAADLQLTNGTSLLLATNNTAKIQQQSATDPPGNYHTLIYLDASNFVRVGPASIPVLIGSVPVGRNEALQVGGNILLDDAAFGLLSRNVADSASVVLVRFTGNIGEFMPGGEAAMFGAEAGSLQRFKVQLDKPAPTASNTIFYQTDDPTTVIFWELKTMGYGGGNVASLGITTGSGSDFVLLQPANSGFVGINTVAPGAALDVAGRFQSLADGTLKVWDGSLKTVSFGANDSGGAGFRLLRVPN